MGPHSPGPGAGAPLPYTGCCHECARPQRSPPPTVAPSPQQGPSSPAPQGRESPRQALTRRSRPDPARLRSGNGAEYLSRSPLKAPACPAPELRGGQGSAGCRPGINYASGDGAARPRACQAANVAPGAQADAGTPAPLPAAPSPCHPAHPAPHQCSQPGHWHCQHPRRCWCEPGHDWGQHTG